MANAVITHAIRTPIGNFLGGLAPLKAHQLSAPLIAALLKQSGLKPDEISEVILGQVLSAGAGQNEARQAAIHGGLDESVSAWTINQVCGSGLRTVALACQAICHGDAEIVIAGGHESMSNAPHAVHLRGGTKMGNAAMVDTMITDGLWDAFNDYHMGQTAENVANKYGISREDQDAFAARSQQKAEAAQKAGKFDAEIHPVTIKTRKGDTVIDTDEFPRHGTTAEGLGKLRPAFTKDGSVTAGNASGINDGAALVIVMSEEAAKKRGLKPLARIAASATCGVDPKIMGTGPIPASTKALEKSGWNVGDLDVIEANEAFAAQAIAVNNEMGWNTDNVNVNGGAIALGHPIGASGARVLVTLLHELNRRAEATGLPQKGLATLCIGGGMGVALALETV